MADIQQLRRYNPNARIGGFLGLELKFLDCAWNGVSIATSTDGTGAELQPSSGCTGAISVPAQGDGESARDGRKYVLKSVWISGVVTTTAFATRDDPEEGFGYFFALVLDTQTNKMTINSEDVYVNPASSGIAILPQPLRNLSNSGRFKILASQYVPMGGQYAFNDAAATGSCNAQISPEVSLSWSGSINCDTAGTAADVNIATDNSLHVLAFAGTQNYAPQFIGKSRVRFMG